MLEQTKLMTEVLVIYFVIISAFAVFITIFDKMRAKDHSFRVPEASLMWVAALGGSFAMYITMRIIRHKTKHPKFMIGIPVLMVLHVAVIIGIIVLFHRADVIFAVPEVVTAVESA